MCPILTGMNKCVLYSLFAGVCPILGVHVPLSVELLRLGSWKLESDS